jgi:hypothetical protein
MFLFLTKLNADDVADFRGSLLGQRADVLDDH